MLRLSLRIKLILGIVAVLVPVIVLLSLNYSAAIAAEKKEVHSEQLRLAQIVSVVLDDRFDEAIALTRTYASDPVVVSLDGQRINPHLSRLASIYSEYDNVLSVFDLKGDLLGSANGPYVLNVRDRQWFNHVLGAKTPLISDVFISRVSRQPIVVGASPVFDLRGELVGTIGSAVSLELLSKTLATVQPTMQQRIFLTDSKGRMAFHTGVSQLSWEERDLSNFVPVSEALAKGRYTSDAGHCLLTDQRTIIATIKSRYGWVVGVCIPEDVAMATVNSTSLNRMFVFGGVIAFCIGFALLIAEVYLRPLRHLTEQALAFGKGNRRQRVKIRSGDELQRLGDSFNTMADEVEQALQVREDFLALASHELRTPLTLIRGHVQWLSIKETAPDKLKSFQVVIKQVDRIDELLQEMLMVSEIQAERIASHSERFALDDLAREVVERMQPIAEDHQLVLEDQGAAIVEADRGQIEVVLSSLIDNAVRFGSPAGQVEIGISKSEQNAVVAVCDFGMGIPAELQDHVFEPFFQVQPAMAKHGGLGLGLYLSQEMINRNGGRMWFVSEQGKGSTFYFSLPLALNQEPPTSTS